MRRVCASFGHFAGRQWKKDEILILNVARYMTNSIPVTEYDAVSGV
jgi:hypothetical protein